MGLLSPFVGTVSHCRLRYIHSPKIKYTGRNSGQREHFALLANEMEAFKRILSFHILLYGMNTIIG